MNMIFKFKSNDKKDRVEAYNSTRMLAAISTNFLDKNKIHYKQFLVTFTEIAHWFNDQKGKD